MILKKLSKSIKITKLRKKTAFVTIFNFIILWCVPISFAQANDFKHGVAVFGDLKYPKNFLHLDYVNPDAPKGGEVKFGVEGGFNSFNNFILKGIPASGLSYIYDSLMESSDDEISSKYALIAKGAKIAKDGLSMEFKLNEKAYFHDGVNISADDVVFSFNQLVNYGHPSYKMSFRDVKNVEKISQYHVKFNFKNNNNRNLPLIIAGLPILPKHFYEKNDFSKSSLQVPVGSGPYKIIDFQINRYIVYQRDKNHWGRDLPINRGRYNFDKITFDYYRDNNVLIEGFKAQKYDFRQENIARNWANSYNIDAVKNGQIIKKELPNLNPSPTQVFILNLRRQKFQDINLRKALTLVFDFEWLKEHIFYGSYERSRSFFTNSNFSYQNFSLPIASSDGFNRKNLIIAQDLLKKAGYKIVDNQLVDPNNNKIEIEFLIDSKSFEMVIAPFIKNLAKIGIKAKMRFVEENQYQMRINNFDYDIVVGVIPQAIVPGSELYAYFHSSQKNIKGAANLMGLDDKFVDEIIEKIIKTRDKKQLEFLCQSLDKYLLTNYFTILQWYNNKHRILYRDIFEFPQNLPKYSLAIESWWIKNNLNN